jgi:hypothetical protein
MERFGYIVIFLTQQLSISIDHRYITAEPAHGLCKLQADVTTPNHQQVFRHLIEFLRFDARERLRVSRARSLVYCGVCPRPADYITALRDSA